MTRVNVDTAATAAERLIDVLAGWGVDAVFICPGSTEAPFLDATLDRREPRVVLTTHETTAVAMADGLSRATGRPSVAYLHANVGLTNGLSSLYAAQLARSPVVVLNGLKPTAIQGRRAFTSTTSIRDLVRQYVKFDWQTLHAGAVAEDVDRAFGLATTEPTGPAWVGLPQDLLAAECAGPARMVGRGEPDARARPAAGAIERAARMLTGAARPLLVAGNDVARQGATAELVELSERLAAPVVTEDRRGLERAAFPSDHPHFAGAYAPNAPVVQRSDVVYFAGSRCFTEFEPTTCPDVPPGATVIHGHCDGGEIGYMVDVDVPLVGDQKLTLLDLLDKVSGPVTADRRSHLLDAHAAWEATRLTPESGPAGGESSVPEVARALGAAVTSDTTVVADAITSNPTLLRALPHTHPDQLHLTSSGSLGWGMGAALGLQLGLPGRHVMNVLGDGGFQFGLPALWTAARYRIPVTFVVLNNGSYAAVGAALTRYGGRAVASGVFPGVDISGPRIADTATAFGVPARRITAAKDVADALTWARQESGPALVEVMTDADDFGPTSIAPR